MPADVSLLVLTPDGAERQYLLAISEVVLGREKGCDIVLDGDDAASRRHAVVRIGEDGNGTLEDLGSANGTLLNGEKVGEGPVELKDGDLMRVGRSEVRFAAPRPEGEEEPPAEDSEVADLGTALLTGSLGRTLMGGRTAMLNSPEAEEGLLRVVLARPTGPRLVVRDATGTREVALGEANLVLGRDPRSDVVLNEPMASRRHASLAPRTGGWLMTDLESQNGFTVNGVRMASRALVPEDTVRIGATTLVFKNIPSGRATTGTRRRRPVVIIPGFSGSELRRGRVRLWPNYLRLASCSEERRAEYWGEAEVTGVLREVAVVPGLFKLEAFGRLGDFMQDELGYRKGRDLLEFAYDWRQDNRKTAGQLADAIRAWREQFDDPTERVTIVAHSMGGLVTRYFLQRHQGSDLVERAIFLGTPHDGSTRSLQIAAAGRGVFGGISLSALRAVVIGFPALYQLMPIYAAATLEDGHDFLPLEDDGWVDPEHRAHLHAAAEFREELAAFGPLRVPSTCIFGYGQKTVARLRLRRTSSGPMQVLEETFDVGGDCAVLEASAVLPGAEIHPVRQQHGALYADADVLRRLKFELMERAR